jgi:hypothetical protein
MFPIEKSSNLVKVKVRRIYIKALVVLLIKPFYLTVLFISVALELLKLLS